MGKTYQLVLIRHGESEWNKLSKGKKMALLGYKLEKEE